MEKIFELRPKKDLLDPTFEGYKLSLDALPVYKHEVPVAVEHLKPSDEQLSYSHVKTFGLHNHLIEDPWSDEIAFFISKDLQIFKINLHSLASQNPEFTSVWQIPQRSERRDGWFNASLSFASSELAVVTDGGGVLHIIDTNIRTSTHSHTWEVKLSNQIMGSGEPFKVIHSILNAEEGSQLETLSVLVLKVESIDQVESQIALSIFGCSEKETPFINCLEWIEYEHKDGNWSFKQLKRLAIPHGLDYASILSPGKSICLIAREPFGIIFDSTRNVAAPLPSPQMDEDESENKVAYTWAETPEEVTLWVNFDKQTSKHDLVVKIESQTLKIVHKNQTYLDGELAHAISVDTSTWTLSDGKLEIILSKNNQSLNWSHLVLNDLRGRKVLDAETAAEYETVLNTTKDKQSGNGGRPPIFSSEQLEECDDDMMDETYIFRFDGETNQFTHKAILSGQLLFFTESAPGLAPAFCLRHDVDGLIWQPMGDELEQPWGCLHTAALQALGYIQASKEQRKFTVAPPDMTYAALCDAFTHVYIYRQPNCSSTGVEMVHRPTGRKVGNIARQQVLNIDSSEECLGAMATNTFLLILTSSSLFAIRVNSD
ncbi:nudC domain-containing protein 1-like [Daphnia pulex]|uniref:nudC domain-containing protein 1-like n=1 Tax=Daphnia pulex TaxID=6669 RepID=UPI001EDF791C|nr:nudC domain-containing protein 1-like [Daphnia pulex]